MEKKISVITVNYNNAAGLEGTIKSVVNQTYPHVEYLILDGASQDNSVDIIKQYADQVDYWVSEPDKGIYHAMNKGIRQAKGDYLIFINSGDFLASPSTFEGIVPMLKKDIVYGACKWVDNEKHTVHSFPEKLTLDFFYRASLPHQAAFIAKGVFDKAGLYSEHFKIASDWELWVKAIFKYGCSYEYIPELISVFDAKGISNQPEGKKLMLKEKEQVFAENFPGIHEDYQYFHTIRNYFFTNLYLKLLRKLRLIRLEKLLRNAKNGY